MVREHSRSARRRSASRALPPLALALFGLGACGQGAHDASSVTASGAGSGFQASSESETEPDNGSGRAIDGGAPKVECPLLEEEQQQLDDTEVAPSTTSQLRVADLIPKLRKVDYEGDLCPRGSVSVDPAPDGSALTLSFSTTELRVEDSNAAGRCQIRLGLDVPKGSSFGNVYLYGEGNATGHRGDADLKVDYGFSAGSNKQTLAQHFGPNTDVYTAFKVMDQVWSPTCGTGDSAHQTELVIDVQAAASGDMYVNLATLDFGLSYVDGARWKNCEDGVLLTPPPSKEGEGCAGPARHGCAEGLDCDIFDAPALSDEFLTGVCTSSCKSRVPMAQDLHCGGIREYECDKEEGLVCHYSTDARANARRTISSGEEVSLMGRCQREVGRDADPCGGSPNLACESNHFCSPTFRTCKFTDGELGSACEDGIAECSVGECKYYSCDMPTAAEGEECDGNTIRCKRGLMCDPDQERCIRDPNHGKEGSSCQPTDTCDPGLTCFRARCTDKTKKPTDTSCEQHEDCPDRFFCDADDKTCFSAPAGTLRGACYPGLPCRKGLTCVDQRCAPESADETKVKAEVTPTDLYMSPAP